MDNTYESFLTEHTAFRSLGRSEVSCRTRILRRSGARRKQGLLQSLGHGQGTEKSAAAVSHGAMPPQPRNRPGHARLSGRHCMPPVVHTLSLQGSRAAPVIRPGRRRRYTVHPPAPEILYWKV